MNAVTDMPSPIIFTDSAAAKVAQLIEEEGNPDLKLRVFVQGGGCSGFKYEMTFDSQINDDDLVFEHCVVIDRTSFLLLSGATIDYVKTLMGENFKISNPNASSGCGCGESFSL